MNFEKETVIKLLVPTINYILDQITFKEGNLSYFPTYSKEHDSTLSSRLGWCYGDLGIAYILWKASLILKDVELERKSIKILQHNSFRRDLHLNIINDAGLCHGSSGIAYIFHKLYLSTKNPAFLDASKYWLDITLRMNNYPSSFGGFKEYRQDIGYIDSAGFLTGSAGIGLVLLSFMDITSTRWDKCLLL